MRFRKGGKIGVEKDAFAEADQEDARVIVASEEIQWPGRGSERNLVKSLISSGHIVADHRGHYGGPSESQPMLRKPEVKLAESMISRAQTADQRRNLGERCEPSLICNW